MTAIIEPCLDSRLEQLAAQYDMAKAEAEKAANDLKAITDAIKFELMNEAPEGETSIELQSPDLAHPLRLTAVESWRVDAKKLKAEDPLTYVRYAKKSTSWTLRAVS
jgi:hypothetical protein